MAKKDPSVKWMARFTNVAMTATNSGEWHYTRLTLESAVTCFNDLGLQGYQLVAKEAIWREQVGRYVKTGKHPGIYFRVVRL